MPVVVTKEYKVISAKTLPNGLCSLGIQFAVFGIVTEGDQELQFKPSKVSLESKQAEVKCTGGTCRINIEFDHFKVSPHPGKKAVEEWLDGLEKIQKTTQGANRIRELKSQISSLH
jgi:hypothetical protein